MAVKMTTLFEQWTKKEKAEKKKAMLKAAKKGGFNAAYTAALGLSSEDTFYRWKKQFPEFAEWCREADMYNKIFLEEVLIKQATGECKGNATSLAIALRNKHGDDYKNPAEGSSSTQNITTNNILMLSKDELKEKVEQQLEQLKALGLNFSPETIIDVKPD